MPLCFEIQVNGAQPLLAGSTDASVLTASLTSIPSRDVLELYTSGLIVSAEHGNEQIEWIVPELKAGDTITIRIVESEAPTKPARRERIDREATDDEERKYYEALKKKYEPQ